MDHRVPPAFCRVRYSGSGYFLYKVEGEGFVHSGATLPAARLRYMSPKYQEPQIDEALKLLAEHSDKIDNIKVRLPGRKGRGV
jgi:hypothetical protein